MNALWLALAWVAFAAFHSAAASLTAKRWVAARWPAAAPWYRLAYNGASLVAALPIFYLSYSLDGAPLWQWTGAWRWLSYGLALAALGGFVVTSRWYDMDTFLGLRQVRERDRQPDGHERFRISPAHRFVRHPWYFCGLVLVWSGDKTLPLLVSTLAITLYLIVGSKLEERKLLAMHGDPYRRYMDRVPGLVPLPWKRLRVEEARLLEG
ncbi:MAG: methyltransferase family protein [Ignavibacteria bacterium]